MMQRITSLLKVRPEEGGLVLLVGLVFMCLQAGQGMGDNAAAALFFVRFGVDFLPYMYVLLGAATFALTLGYAAGLGRIQRQRFYRGLTIGLAAALILERAALLHPFQLLYPILWLTISCIGMIVGTFTWNLAGEVTDARQAKRLFPLFTSAGILGSVLGNAITGLIAKSLGTENLLLFYAGLIAAAHILTRQIDGKYIPSSKPGGRRAGLLADLRSGYDFVRGSRLMKLMGYSAVLFSIMFFSVAFPFSKVVTASFPNEASVAGFLGLFTGITTAITFLVSLLIANRIYGRIGIINSLLVLPIVYAVGFLVFGSAYSLTGGLIARFAQLVVLSGIASAAYSAIFNVVPSQKRGQVLAFENGVPSQIGVALSGVLLVLGNRLLTTNEILLLGLVVSAGCGTLVWRMRGAYGEALVEALRAGRLEVFSADQAGFAGLRADAGALQAATGALEDARPSTRRLAAEILGRMLDPGAVTALRSRLKDEDAGVRAAVISALGQLHGSAARDDAVEALGDNEASVRQAALQVLGQADGALETALAPRLQTLLGDASPAIRSQALVALARLVGGSAWRYELNAWIASGDAEVRVAGLETFGKIAACCDANLDPMPVIGALEDPSLIIRVAACRGLSGLRSGASNAALVGALRDPQAEVRDEAAKALRERGPSVQTDILRVLDSGDETACGAALDALAPGAEDTVVPLRRYARGEIERLGRLRQEIDSLPTDGRTLSFLRANLEDTFGRGEVRLVKAVGLIGNAQAMDWVQKRMIGSDTQTRAAALEALETLGDKRLAREVISLLDERPPRVDPEAALERIIAREDRWPRALAIRAAAEMGLQNWRARFEALTKDPDVLVWEAAAEAVRTTKEEIPVSTLKTVSTLERVLLLREVPIFSELAPQDLERVAEIASEEWFPANTAICQEGEEGSNMYIIVDGRLQVIHNSNGKPRLLAERGRGDFVGEMAIIESAPRSATLMTQSEVRVLTIDGETFKSILRERPEVSVAMLRNFSRRLRDMSA